MATILRTSRYLQGIIGCAGIERIVNRHAKCVGQFAGNLLHHAPAIPATLPRYELDGPMRHYGTSAAVFELPLVSDLAKTMSALEFRAHRFGRVSKAEIEEALRALRAAGTATSMDALLLLDCCGIVMASESPAARKQLTDDVWNTVQDLGAFVDVSHYNALLWTYLEDGRTFSPADILSEMKRRGIEPNVVTYQRLIMGYCTVGDIAGATKMLEHMKEEGLTVDECILNALIVGHSRAGDLESSVGILSVMDRARIEPSAQTYTALLCAFARSGDIESMRRYLSECRRKNVDITNRDLMSVVYTLAVNGHSEHVDEVISVMTKEKGFTTNATILMLRLIEAKREDVAVKMLLCMREQLQNEHDIEDKAHLFSEKLINCNASNETIIKCSDSTATKYGSHLIMAAVKCALRNGDLNQCKPLLSAWKVTGARIKEHYFWPLLVRAGIAQDVEGIKKIILCMTKEFNVPLNHGTMWKWIMTYLPEDWELILDVFRNAGQSQANIANAFLHYILAKGDIVTAAKFASKHAYRYSTKYHSLMINALVSTNDVESFITLAHSIYKPLFDINDTLSNLRFSQFVHHLTLFLPKDKGDILGMILDGFAKRRLHFSPEVGEELRKKFGETISMETLKKLTDLTYRSLPNESRKTDYFPRERVKSRKVVTMLESQNYTRLLDFYVRRNDLDGAGVYVKKLRETNTLDVPDTLKYAEFLIKHDHLDDAVRFLKSDWTRSSKVPELHEKICSRMLRYVASTGNADHVRTLFEALKAKNYLCLRNSTLHPLIAVHVARNDLKAALKTLEWMYNNYKCIPETVRLAKEFINAEDVESLQRLTDIKCRAVGETNALYSLVFAFVECGRIRQARRILETPGLVLLEEKITNIMKLYEAMNNVSYLMGLLELTKGLHCFDRVRSLLYLTVLKMYYRQDKWQEALDLWTKMREDVRPSQDFLQTLAELLTKHNQPVPFAYSVNIAEPASRKRENM